MAGSVVTANRYRNHALQVREAAKDMADPHNSRSLRLIADNYERLARTIESATGEK